jgi:Fe-S cluster assembly protein SufD
MNDTEQALKDNAIELWSKTDRAQAFEAAQKASRPKPYVEDWRKTNPDLFPWDRFEDRSKENQHEVILKDPESLVLADLGEYADQLRDMLSIAGDDYDAKFMQYHRALHSTPVCVVAKSNTKPEPVEILQKTTGPGVGFCTTLIIVESGAELTVYDRWDAPEQNPAVVGRTEILMQPGSHLNYIQEDRIHSSGSIYRRARVRMERDSVLSWTLMTPGAAWHAARLEVDLNGINTDAKIYGLFPGAGKCRADHRTHQYHGAPNSQSKLTFKTLLAGEAHSVYQGMITVPRQAQKTDAYQQCRNLMLDPHTHADAIPMLEIIADDVKCSHGASIGTLSEEQMFYLRSRGLNHREALTAVASGFAEEIILHVPLESVQAAWRELVSKTINQASGKI